MVENVEFLNSEWEILNINANITDSNTKLLELTCKRLSFVDFQNFSPKFYFENNVLGSWFFDNISDIVIRNCSIIKPVDYWNKTILKFLRSLASMENTVITDVTFTQTNLGVMLSESEVTVAQSQFINNKVTAGLFNVVNKSTLQVQDCTFWQNKASCIGSTIVAYSSRVFIQNSDFRDNFACQGGAVYISNHAFCEITNSYFAKN